LRQLRGGGRCRKPSELALDRPEIAGRREQMGGTQKTRFLTYARLAIRRSGMTAHEGCELALIPARLLGQIRSR
jgi:hypothetical protein